MHDGQNIYDASTTWNNQSRGYVPMLYFDRGTETVDARYGPYDDRMVKLVRSKGYGTANLMSYVAHGAAHEERAWRDRLHLPFRFILHK